MTRCSAPQQMENVDAERDVYDELLTQAEIQGNVNKVNGEFQELTLICRSARGSPSEPPTFLRQ